VVIDRFAYHRRGQANLHRADGVLNLPVERHSRGLRQLAPPSRPADPSTRPATSSHALPGRGRPPGWSAGPGVGGRLRRLRAAHERPLAQYGRWWSCPRRQARRYAPTPCAIHRPGRRQDETQAARAAVKEGQTQPYTHGRTGAVSTVTPVPRSPAYVMARPDEQHAHKPAPKAEHEWLTTSVADAAEVIAQVINEASPRPLRGWVALVDATATRSTLSAPRHAATTCRSASSSTSCTCRTQSSRCLIECRAGSTLWVAATRLTLRLRSVRTGGLS
jgi:hypothetical protein